MERNRWMTNLIARLLGIAVVLSLVVMTGGCAALKQLLADPEAEKADLDFQTEVHHRMSFIVEDRSLANRWRQESNRRIGVAIAGRCGPGDKLVIAYMRPRFFPEECVMAAAEFPPDCPAYHAQPRNRAQFDTLATALTAAWETTAEMQAQLAAFLGQPVTEEEDAYEGVLFGAALEYAAHELGAASSYEEKHLFIFGPLPEQVEMPDGGIPLEGVHVKALYCPRPSSYDWARVKDAWRQYLVEQSKAADFIMLDRAQSVGLDDSGLFASSSVPQRPTSPFVTARP